MQIESIDEIIKILEQRREESREASSKIEDVNSYAYGLWVGHSMAYGSILYNLRKLQEYSQEGN